MAPCRSARAQDRATPPPGDAPSVEERVEVVGDPIRDPVGPRDRSLPASAVGGERLRGPGLQPQDVLRTQPGVAVTETAGFGAPATAAIRGATAAETPVYLGGVRLNDDVGGTADLSLVPLWLIDRIEIYRGHAPLDADRLGPGGAIFFEPRRPAASEGAVGTYGGSWGADKGWVYRDVQSGPLSAIVGVSADRATNRYPFPDNHGELFEPGLATVEHRRNADERTFEGWALASADLGHGAQANLLFNAISREQGVPSLALLPTRAARAQATRELASLTLTVPLDPDARSLLEARSSILVGSTTYRDPLLELALETTELRMVGRRVEQSIEASLAPSAWLRVRPVALVAHEGLERDPDTVGLGRTRRDSVRAAVSAEARLGGAAIVDVLASGECHRTGVAPDQPCDILAPTGRFGGRIEAGPVVLLGDVGRYVRVPTLGELYGISGAIHGNAALVPETGTSVDVGARVRARRGGLLSGAYADAFGFARWADDLIAYERTGQGFITPYNIHAARVLGVELLAGIVLAGVVRAELAATSLDPRDVSSGRQTVNDILPFRSRLVLAPRVGADWKTKNGAGLCAFGVQVSALYQSSRYIDAAGLGVIAAQTTFDAEAYARWFGGRLTFRARVADVFDAFRTDFIGYPLPGRSAYFGSEATW